MSAERETDRESERGTERERERGRAIAFIQHKRERYQSIRSCRLENDIEILKTSSNYEGLRCNLEIAIGLSGYLSIHYTSRRNYRSFSSLHCCQRLYSKAMYGSYEAMAKDQGC